MYFIRYVRIYIYIFIHIANKPKIFLRPNAQQGAIGEPYELYCSVSLSSTLQSSLVNLTWDFTSNDNRVTVIPTTITTDDSIGIIYTTVIRFAYVIEGDERSYKCTMEIEEDITESSFYFEIKSKYNFKLNWQLYLQNSMYISISYVNTFCLIMSTHYFSYSCSIKLM